MIELFRTAGRTALLPRDDLNCFIVVQRAPQEPLDRGALIGRKIAALMTFVHNAGSYLMISRYTEITMRRIYAAAFVCGLAAVAGRADVTLRYSFDMKPGPMLPPQAVEAMKKQMQFPITVSSRLKGNKAYSAWMGINAISDFDGALITILDPKNK